VLAGPLPADPAAEIDRRLQERRALVQAERDAERHAAEASRAMAKAERAREQVTASIRRQRDRLVVDRDPLWDRVARVVGPEAPGAPTPPQDGADPTVLQAYATLLDEALTAAAAAAARRLGGHDDLERRLLDETSRVVGDLVEPSPTLEALAQAVTAACRAATAEVATAHQRAEDLAAKLQRRTELAEEVKLLDHRTRLFRKLALELDEIGRAHV